MAGSGSENRQRTEVLKMRCTAEEAALIREQAKRHGVSVGSLMRYATLGLPPLRASRHPGVDAELAGRLLGMLARYISEFKSVAAKGTPGACDESVAAACRDASEMRVLWFKVFGREP
ncbi:plasmid mobilization protein [Sinorhizobium fredii]|uniref:plasmid mobilization protein n=1 Tax=Rhizobium fredii TaxID=380 RepID=UPI0005957091|nr:hypothetical protein [Sinorhizobium fredii]WOS62029.1 hypothetical protein SFGR64A_13890 [Sinorhizobium fredii GR64]